MLSAEDTLQTLFLFIRVVCIFLGRHLMIQFVKCCLPGLIASDCESSREVRDRSFHNLDLMSFGYALDHMPVQ